MRIGSDTYQCNSREAFAAVAPAGTLGEASESKELMQGTLFSEWAVACRTTTCRTIIGSGQIVARQRHSLFLTRNDLATADNRPEVAFALNRETSEASCAMLDEMQGLYQVPVNQPSDRFSCPVPFTTNLLLRRAAMCVLLRDELFGELNTCHQRRFHESSCIAMPIPALYPHHNTAHALPHSVK